jgi:hypothetical protein
MRLIALIGLGLLAACADGGCAACGIGDQAALNRTAAAYVEARRQAEQSQTQAQTPAERAKKAQEDELLERALTNSPDYTAAVRRAAIANVDAEQPPAGRRTPAATQAREQRITAEEARLSDAVEKRRRDRLSQQARSDKAARDQQAIATCRARGAQMDAAYYNPRSLLNLEGMAAGNQAAAACFQAYQQTGILP